MKTLYLLVGILCSCSSLFSQTFEAANIPFIVNVEPRVSNQIASLKKYNLNIVDNDLKLANFRPELDNGLYIDDYFEYTPDAPDIYFILFIDKTEIVKGQKNLELKFSYRFVVTDVYGNLLFTHETVDRSQQTPDQNDLTKVNIILKYGIDQYKLQVLGYKYTVPYKLAFVKGTKDKELLALEEYKNKLIGACKNDKVTCANLSEEYFAKWESFIDYNGISKEPFAVSRAALNNLVTFHLFRNEYGQAQTYLDKYKTVDQRAGGFIGGYYFQSKILQEVLDELSLPPKDLPADARSERLDIGKVTEEYDYLTIVGEIFVARDSKTMQRYVGKLMVKYKPYYGSSTDGNVGNIISIGRSKKGEYAPPIKIIDYKTGDTILKNLHDLQFANEDSTGIQYIAFGASEGEALMKSTFLGKKIEMFRTVIPVTSKDFFVIRKPDTTEGMDNMLMYRIKKLKSLLNDCPSVTARIDSKEFTEDTPQEEILKAYEECFSGK